MICSVQVPDIPRDPGAVRADGAAGLPGPALPQLGARVHRRALRLPGMRKRHQSTTN